jgi:hypothetical protein
VITGRAGQRVVRTLRYLYEASRLAWSPPSPPQLLGEQLLALAARDARGDLPSVAITARFDALTSARAQALEQWLRSATPAASPVQRTPLDPHDLHWLVLASYPFHTLTPSYRESLERTITAAVERFGCHYKGVTAHHLGTRPGHSIRADPPPPPQWFQ